MEPLDIKLGRYTLVSKVGDGSIAEVFKARMMGPGHFEKTVALKKILPNLASNEKFRRSFIDEARICGQLHHHNIVEVYEVHDDGKDLYLAMEFIDGLNLEDVLDYHREIEQSMTTDVVMSIMVQVLEGLEYAHTARSLENQPFNVIHRDLKPSNILIDNEGVIKIVDFGVARAANRRYETQEMTAKGNASYMAPEQLLGDKPVTQASDIFSVGAMFYEMLTLERLFDGEHVFAILKQVATMDINEHLEQTIFSADRKFLSILHRALARELSDRYKSAAEMLRDLLGLHIVGRSPRRLADHLRELRNTAESFEDAATRLVTDSDDEGYEDEEDIGDHETRLADTSNSTPGEPPGMAPLHMPRLTTKGPQIVDRDNPLLKLQLSEKRPPTDSPQEDRSIPLKDAAFLLSLAPLAGQVIMIPPGERVVIGRSSSWLQRKIVLEDPSISRKHCIIERTDHGYVIHDCDSSNHTYVNGQRVTRFPLQSGDEIQIPPRYRFIFISYIRTAQPMLVNIKEVRDELASLISDPAHIRMHLSDAGISPGSLPTGTAQLIWHEVIEGSVRRNEFPQLLRVLRTVIDAGFKSEVLERTRQRLDGVVWDERSRA